MQIIILHKLKQAAMLEWKEYHHEFHQCCKKCIKNKVIVFLSNLSTCTSQKGLLDTLCSRK